VRDPIRIGRYTVHETVASGGMASVHFGRFAGPGGFARTVAIKRMHRHLCNDPEFVAMFLDEARLVARIRHPNVVPTLDVLAVDGELLIVMEYVHGESLAQLARLAAERRKRIPPAITSAVVCDLLAGLHAAHEATDERGGALGVIHRDVSPENVLVGVDGAARVVDFGVAKAIGRLQVTREGQVKGKIAYMAPEQVRGRGRELDRRADVYAASVVLWQLLTGRKLFEGMRDGQLVEAILFGTIDAPAAVAPHVPEALNGIVLRGLARDPGDRFATARDMAEAIRAAVRPASTSGVSDWVETTAGDVLAARASVLVAIDREEGGDRKRVPPAQSATETDRLNVVLHTDLSGAAPDRLRRLWPIAAAMAALAAVAFAARAHDPATPQAGPSPAQSASLATEPPGTPAEASTTEQSSPPPTPQAPSSAASRKRAAPAPAIPTTRPGKGACDPPYTTDPHGTRIYKMQCL
jgi:serine/threonine-protein kinase